MKTIKRYEHKDSNIEVIETTDGGYAHDCFDGTDTEWAEVLTEAYLNNPPVYYIVSAGLSGLYTSDTVYVFGSRQDALTCAKDTLELWQEQDAEESENQ